MNRAIKFRVWHAGIKKMLYPPLAHDSSNHCRDIEGNIIEFISKHKKPYGPKVYFESQMDWKGRWYEEGELQDAVFLQFTGLLDKNGREIYEGDLVNFYTPGHPHGPEREDHTFAEVWYDDSMASFVFDKVWYDGFHGNSALDIKDIEVVGNIFENPEKVKEYGS